MAFFRDHPPPRVPDFPDETVDMEPLEVPTGSAPEGRLLPFAALVRPVEDCDELPVGEALDDPRPLEDGPEQRAVAARRGIDRAVPPAFVFSSACRLADLFIGLAGIFDDRERFEVAPVGRMGHLGESIQVPDALVERKPPGHRLPVLLALAAHFEVVGMVDHGFHPQDETLLVVHFDPVAFCPVFDPATVPAVFEITDQLALEPAIKLLSQEAHHVLCAELEHGVVEEFSV